MKVPLQPLGKQDIHLLETALLVMALFDPEVMEEIKNPEKRVTWIDSLAVAAAAFARRKAGMSIPEIAEELGRTESTIRNHLEGKTKAGQIIQKVYERLVKKGGEIEISIGEEAVASKKLEEIKKKVEEMGEHLKKVVELFDELKKILE